MQARGSDLRVPLPFALDETCSVFLPWALVYSIPHLPDSVYPLISLFPVLRFGLGSLKFSLGSIPFALLGNCSHHFVAHERQAYDHLT